MTTPSNHPANRTDNDQGPRRNLSTILWGATLVILGTLFLLDQILTVNWDIFQDWWPVALIVAGLFSRGHVLTAVGAWLLIAKLELFGFTYSSAWPVILMIIGAGMLVDAITGGGKRRLCAPSGQRGDSR